MSQPDKVLLYGGGATGKTVSLATIIEGLNENGRAVIVMTERNAVSGLQKGLEVHKVKLQPNKLITVFPKKKEKAFSNLSLSVKEFQSHSLRQNKAGNSDTTEGREKFTYFQDIINSLNNFVGEDFLTKEEVKIGNVGDLTSDDVLIVDGWTPIVSEIWSCITGVRLSATMADYMPVQRVCLDVVRNLHALECHVVLLAHEKQTYKDVPDGRGGTTSSPDKVVFNSGCGEANYEQIIGNFTDVIRTVNKGNGRFMWEVKGRNSDTRIRKNTFSDRDTEVEPSFSKWGFFK